MATLQRRTQRRRLHQPRGGWNPIEHNAAVRLAKDRNELSRQISIRFRVPARLLGPRLRAFGIAAQKAANAVDALAESLRRTHAYVLALAAARQYGIDSELSEEDTDFLISAELRQARAAGTQPDWPRLRTRMDGESVRQALMGGN